MDVPTKCQAPRGSRLARVTQAHRGFALAAGTATLVTVANASQGAYFSQSWGWVALAFLTPTALLLILGYAKRPETTRTAFVLLISALAGWTLLSAAWSLSEPGTFREVERMVVYVSVALAIAIVLRRGDGPPVLAGIVAGTSLVCAYAVATRLAPDWFPTYDEPTLDNRLAQPLGYPNSLAVLCAIGLLLTLAFVSHGSSITALTASLALPVQATAFYFTFGRAAWGGLALSLAVVVALDPRWLRSLWMSCLACLPSILVVILASRQRSLTSIDAGVAQAADEGHRIALVLCGATLCSAAVTLAAYAVARKITITPTGRRIATGVALASILIAASGTLLAIGGPSEGASRVRHSFETLPVGATTNLNERLFRVYGSGRAELWPVAWEEFRSAPLAGTGAGTFEYVWYANRPTTRIVRDAHSLGLEVLTELGVIGGALLALALLLAVVAGIRARRSRFVPFATAALLCWAFAAAFDWHWEMVGLSVTAILAGAAGLLARAPKDARVLGGIGRALPLTFAVALSAFAVVSLVGNQALFAARANLVAKRWIEARADAVRAQKLLPWSFEPDVALGDARAGLGDREGALRAYREGVNKDPRNWLAWLRVAQLADGEERRRAYSRVRELNPRESNLPGERQSFG